MSAMPACESDILFIDFVKLLNSISCVQADRSKAFPSPSVLDLVKKWILTLKQHFPLIPASTCKIFFRLLFPEEDVRRRYNVQETTLAKTLVQIFSLPVGEGCAGQRLMGWSDVEARTNVGCLGIEVERALRLRHSGNSTSLTFREIDGLLDNLASMSGYSHSDIREKRDPTRPRMSVLKGIFATMSPAEAKFMTQIILKDLRPVLYPMWEINTTRALLHHKSNEMHVLTKWEVMRAWHPSMPKIYRLRATLDAACDALEENSQLGSNGCSPMLGIPIEIPKSQKGRSLSHVLQFFKGQQEVWAETKYDGERMQIHIDLSKSYNQQITIFSKSKRDSTLDRMGTHSIIRAALSLPLRSDCSDTLLLSRIKSGSRKFESTVILDAEMVAYSERDEAIDEFWRIRSLIESTALGIRSAKQRTKNQTEPLVPCESQSTQNSGANSCSQNVVEDSLVSNASDCSDRHLKVVFFDVLSIDGSSLLQKDYRDRRAQLESLINPILGFASLSQRDRIDISRDAVESVARIFAEHIADYQEGIVLKGATSTYNDNAQPWVKLKRDYIPDYGDTVDLVLIGASWNKSRARELRVAPQTFTTFFVAAAKAIPTGVERADFQVLFVVEYGMSREELESLNFYIKHTGYHTYSTDQMANLSYNFSLPSALGVKPAVMFIQPLLGEIFGAGFTKDSGTLHYSLRFPRLTKVWRPAERPWTAGVDLKEFQRLARSAIGHESRDDWANRSVESIWGNHTRVAPRDRSVVENRFEEWYEKLLDLENLRYSRSTGETYRRQHNELKRKPEMEDFLSKRKKYQDQNHQFNMEGSLAAVALSTPQTNVKGTNSSSLVATMKKMIPMSPGLRTPRNDQVVMVDISQMLAVKKPSNGCSEASTEKYPTRSSELSDGSNLSFELNATKESDGSGDKHNGHYDWKMSSIIKFIQDAYVWIPKDRQGKRPTTRPPASDIISYDQRIGAIYFLLIICGCRVEVDGVAFEANVKQFVQAKKCVIFVDTGDDPDKREAFQWLMNALESWRQELNKETSKELFVFDSNLLTYAAMSSLPSPDNIEAAALWRSHNL